MNKTAIQWTNFSANPLKYRRKCDGKTVRECVKTSPGCAHCYAESIGLRWKAGKLFTAANMEEVEPFVDDAELRHMVNAQKVGGRKVAGSMCFVDDMTDLFGDWVPDELIDRQFAAFALRGDVTWQVLTKRAGRMLAYTTAMQSRAREWGGEPEEYLITALHDADETLESVRVACRAWLEKFNARHLGWPLPNVWLGVSAEDQRRADERVPLLLQTPAAVRFVSHEPALSWVDPVPAVDWWIIGCESIGPRVGRLGEFKDADDFQASVRRELHQCKVHGIAAFNKQVPIGKRVSGDMAEWPEQLRVRQFPEVRA